MENSRKPAADTFTALKKAIGMRMTAGENGFLRDHIIPKLPETFWGASQDFLTPETDDGPPYYQVTSEVRRSPKQIRTWLKNISPMDDVTRFFNARPWPVTSEAKSIIDGIKALLASE